MLTGGAASHTRKVPEGIGALGGFGENKATIEEQAISRKKGNSEEAFPTNRGGGYRGMEERRIIDMSSEPETSTKTARL